MNKRLANYVSILVAAIFIVMMCSFFGLTVKSESAYAAEINNVAKQTLSVQSIVDPNGTKVVKVNGLQSFKDGIDNYTISNKEKAKYMYRIIGEDEYTISTFTDEQLLEALNFEETTIKENFICSGDDGQTYLTKNDLIQRLSSNPNRLTDEGKEFLSENNIDINAEAEPTISPMSSTTTTSNDGYLRLVTTATKTSGAVSGRTYYVVSARASWLLVPMFLKQDVLAISSNATYDDTYNNYGYFYEKCDEYVGSESSGHLYSSTVVDNKIYKNTGANNPDDIMFEYTAGIAGLGLRFNMFEGVFVGDTAHQFVYRSITAYLQYKVSLYNADAGVQAGYAHKQFTLWGDITLKLVPLGISFGLSGIGGVAKYFGETLSLYY